MKVVGLDLSLTSTGLAAGFTGRATEPLVTHRIRTAAGISEARLTRISNEATEWCFGAALAVIESPTPAGAVGVHTEIAWLYHQTRIRLWRASIPFALATPQHVKIYATGKGNADKDSLLLAAARAFPTAEITGNDEADAAWLAAMGCHWAGHPLLDRTPAHTRVITGVAKAKGVTPVKGVTWPAPLTDALALAATGGDQ